tara:strand:- start:177 stop:419 length:243 start_codon:yes stop_codon:yes gene_type:complete
LNQFPDFFNVHGVVPLPFLRVLNVPEKVENELFNVPTFLQMAGSITKDARITIGFAIIVSYPVVNNLLSKKLYTFKLNFR